MRHDENRAREQVARLTYDVALLAKTLETRLSQTPPTADTSEEYTFVTVTGDLWRMTLQHLNATAYLLNADLAEPAAVVYRAAYETMATLNYILSRPTRGEQIEAALLHYAHSRLEIAKWFAGSAEKADTILALMPAGVVEKASENHRAKRGPFGLSLKQTAEAAGFEGHDWNYAVLSWEGHARMAGDHVDRKGTDPTGLHELRFIRQVDPSWTWALANQARRFLHGTYEALARIWLGSIPPLQTTDPRSEKP